MKKNKPNTDELKIKTVSAKQIADALMRFGFGSDERARASMESIIDGEIYNRLVQADFAAKMDKLKQLNSRLVSVLEDCAQSLARLDDKDKAFRATCLKQAVDLLKEFQK